MQASLINPAYGQTPQPHTLCASVFSIAPQGVGQHLHPLTETVSEKVSDCCSHSYPGGMCASASPIHHRIYPLTTRQRMVSPIAQGWGPVKWGPGLRHVSIQTPLCETTGACATVTWPGQASPHHAALRTPRPRLFSPTCLRKLS